MVHFCDYLYNEVNYANNEEVIKEYAINCDSIDKEIIQIIYKLTYSSDITVVVV